MNKEAKKKLKQTLKETPESKIEKLIDLIGLRDIEKDIAFKRCVEHKGVVQICNEINISESTYHRAFDIILKKIDNMMS